MAEVPSHRECTLGLVVPERGISFMRIRTGISMSSWGKTFEMESAHASLLRWTLICHLGPFREGFQNCLLAVSDFSVPSSETL